MKTEIYTCDFCKKSKSEEDLSSFMVQTRGITISEEKHYGAVNFDICKDCLSEKGFVVNPHKDELEPAIKKNKKNIEDHIVDWLYDQGVQFYE